MIRGSALQSLLLYDRPLTRSFAAHTTYVTSAYSSALIFPKLPGADVPTATYTSFARFAASIAAHRLPRSVHAVLYDIERWPATPVTEQREPRLYMLRFSRLARAHGLQPILAPARDLMLVPGAACGKAPGESLSQAYLRCGLARADAGAGVFVVQSQVAQGDVPGFRGFTTRAAQQARAGDRRVAVLAQLATAPLGRPASLSELVTAARSVSGLVQGFSLNVRRRDVSAADRLLHTFQGS